MTTPERINAFLKEVFELREMRAKQAESEARDTCSNGNASTAAAVGALYAIWKVFNRRNSSEPVSKATPTPSNLFVANHLSWLCNSALAIRTLTLKGMEPQARVIMRSFIEAIYQTLVIFSDYDSYIAFVRGKDIETSKEVYYEVFSKKKRLHKKLQKLEDDFKRSPDYERDQQYEERILILERYSQATHSSAIHVLTSSLQPNHEGSLEPTILGQFTLATENTLLNCSHEICYFCLLFDHIVKNTWKVEDIESDKDYEIFSGLFKLAATFRTHKVKSGENRDMPGNSNTSKLDFIHAKGTVVSNSR